MDNEMFIYFDFSNTEMFRLKQLLIVPILSLKEVPMLQMYTTLTYL